MVNCRRSDGTSTSGDAQSRSPAFRDPKRPTLIHGTSVAHCIGKLHDRCPQRYLECVLRLAPHWSKRRVLKLAPKYWRSNARTIDPRTASHRAAVPVGRLRRVRTGFGSGGGDNGRVNNSTATLAARARLAIGFGRALYDSPKRRRIVWMTRDEAAVATSRHSDERTPYLATLWRNDEHTDEA